jgi:hypothetical protein
MSFITKSRENEKKNFYSKIESGSINAFIQQDFKSQAGFADSKTRLKLQSIFLRKELGTMKDARQIINEKFEKEKQEMRSYGNKIKDK